MSQSHMGRLGFGKATGEGFTAPFERSLAFLFGLPILVLIVSLWCGQRAIPYPLQFHLISRIRHNEMRNYLPHFNLRVSILARPIARAASDSLVALDAKENKFTFAWALASKIVFSEVKYSFADATPSTNNF